MRLLRWVSAPSGATITGTAAGAATSSGTAAGTRTVLGTASGAATASGTATVASATAPATDTGGIRYGTTPTRPHRVRRRRRYLASKSCAYQIFVVRHRRIPRTVRTHHTYVRHTATRHIPNIRTHHGELVAGNTRTATTRTEIRCDLYRPPTPRQVADRLAELYAELN